MKPIKFNLVLSGRIVRSIEELKDDFNLDDVYDLYQKRILQKWLKIHEEHSVLEKLDTMDVTDTRSELRGILSAFGYHENVMDVELSSHIYKKIHEEEVSAFISNNQMYDEVIEGYHVKYEFLKKRLHELVVIPIKPIQSNDSEDTGTNDQVDRYKKDMQTGFFGEKINIIEDSNSNDKSVSMWGALNRIRVPTDIRVVNKETEKGTKKNTKKKIKNSKELNEMLKQASKTYGEIKAIVQALMMQHHELLKLDMENFFAEYLERNPVVIMVCLMNVRARELIMDHQKIRPALMKVLQDAAFLRAISPYTKTYAGNTSGMWKYLGDVGKTYLVLKVSKGASKVGEQQDLKVELTDADLNGEYLLLDGLTFKSSSENQSILYMEV